MSDSGADKKTSTNAFKANSLPHDSAAPGLDLSSDLLAVVNDDVTDVDSDIKSPSRLIADESSNTKAVSEALLTRQDSGPLTMTIDCLRGFVPLNVLSDDHLYTVSRISQLDFLLCGQRVIDADLFAHSQLFLTGGCVRVDNADGTHTTVYAGCSGSDLSLTDRFTDISSITAIEDSQLIVTDRDKLDAMLCWDQVAKTLAVEFSADRHFDEDIEWMNTLLCSNLFHRIPPYNVKQIFDQFEPRVVQSGETIVRQGEQGDICYIIKEGQAVVTVTPDTDAVIAIGATVGSNMRDRQAPQVVALLGPGKCFGEDALLNKTRRNASVTMESNGVVMCLKKRDFFALMAEPEVAALSQEQAEYHIANGARWLDVRSQQEFDNAHKKDAFHLPMHLMTLKSRLMDSETEYVAYCSTGRRASTVAYLLSQQGYKVQSMAG